MMTRELESIVQQQPVLWVGAGLSVAAGCPSTDAILAALRAVADVDLPGGEFTAVVDAFVTSVGAGELGDVLQGLFQRPHAPTPTHQAVARLAKAGRFTAIVTTNYDDLLERALAVEGVKVVVQTLESNAAVREQDGALRLLKIHGSYTDWTNTILSGSSYAAFEARYGFLRAQLEVLLQQHPLIFVGCSLQDPRVLQWIEGRPDTWTRQLKRWRAVMRPSAWTAALEMAWKGGKAGAVLTRAPLKPISIERHEELPVLWLEVAKKLAPLAVGELVFDVDPGEDQWRSVGPTTEFAPHLTPNPLRDDAFLRDLHHLCALMRRPVLAGHPQSAAQTVELRHVARRVGSRLTDTLFSADARVAVCKRIAEVDRGTARLTLRIAEGPRADAALALSWELLMPESGRFAVEETKLDLVRDAVKRGAPELDVPSAPLSVAATIAAPDDQTALRYEDESYRVLKALAPLGQGVHFAELGEVDDLVELVRRTQATVVHFSGHGLPGQLVFEDELGLSKRVRVDDLMTRLRQRVQPSGVSQTFPRLFFLAACHGASATATPAGGAELDSRTVRAEIEAALGEGPSTAATLHREGFACVLGYFGPIGDAVSTAAEVALYTSLSEGGTILHATKQARGILSHEHEHAGQRYCYPLGWAQLAVYLRGTDRPLTARPQSADTVAPVPPRLGRETIEVSGLPVLEHGFIGRRALQHEVRRKFKEGQRLFVLQGLGGLGKTALASQLLCKVFAKDPRDQLILRVQDATDLAALSTQAEAHGDTHALPGWQDQVKDLHERYSDPVEGFRQTVLAMRRHRPTLVLYADNMEALQVGPGGVAEAEPGALGSWKPGVERWWAAMESLARDGVVLASTRYTWTGLSREALVPLDRMSRADLWRMLETFPTLAKLPWSVREKVADMADGRPRTIERLEGLLRQADDDPTRDIRDAWTEWVAPVLAQHGAQLTEDLLLAQLWHLLTPNARDHAIATCVLQQPAPRRVIDVLGTATAELLRAGLLIRHRELTAVSTGNALRLDWEDRWSMHTSVRQFAFSWGSPDELRRARGCAARKYTILVKEFGARWSDLTEAIRLYLEDNDSASAWPLARKYVSWLRQRAQYRTALDMLERASWANLRGDAHLEQSAFLAQLRGLAGIQTADLEADLRAGIETADSAAVRAVGLHELAVIFSQQGNYGKAESLLRDSLLFKESAQGREHPDYGASLHALAGVLSEQGKYGEAECVLRDCLSILEKGLGREHFFYGASMHELAGVLARMGRHAEAERLLRDALNIAEKRLGRKHPSYGHSLHTLADVLSQQGKYSEAERLLRDALSIFDKALGREHTDYGSSLQALACAVSRQGNYDEAERLLREALAIIEKGLGREHPDYGTSLHDLAGVLARRGRYGDAEHVFHEALAIIEKGLGREHPIYAISLQNFAEVLSAQGKYGEAERLLRDSLAIIEKGLGREHSAYATSLNNLAGVLMEQRKYGEAERLLRDCLSIHERVLGHEHPDYGASLHVLATVLSRQSKYAEAERLLRDCLSLVERTLGHEHPEICPTLSNLAIVVTRQGRSYEGIGLLERAIAIGLATLGEKHRNVQFMLNELQKIKGLA